MKVFKNTKTSQIIFDGFTELTNFFFIVHRVNTYEIVSRKNHKLNQTDNRMTFYRKNLTNVEIIT